MSKNNLVRALCITALAPLLAVAAGPAVSAPPPTAKVASRPPVTPRPLPPPVVAPDVPTGDAALRDAVLAAKASDIFDAFSCGDPTFTPDGKTIVFRSNRDGLPQIYAADATKPLSAPRRLVTTTERTVDPQVTPDGKWVVFRSDKGADENFSIFRVALDGTGLTELTPAEPINHDHVFLPEGAPGAMFYSARARKDRSASVYAHTTSGSTAPRLVYTDPATAFLVDVSRDGKWGLLIRLASASDSKLLLVDLDKGSARPIYPAAGTTEYVGDAAFSADGARIFLATDGGGEDAILLALDAKTLGEVARYVEKKPATARIDTFAVDPKGDRLAAMINAGNHSEMRLLDARTLVAKSTPKLPLGAGGAPVFTVDGKTIAVAWSTPNVPQDLFAIDAKSGKVRPLRAEPRPSLKKLPVIEASITEVVSFDGTKIPVNVYRPAKLAKGARLPVLVAVHGGPSSSAAVRFSVLHRFHTASGFIIVEPNVRGSTGFGRAYERADDGPKRMDAVKDLEAVGRWVVAQPWADPERLVVIGGSYGGYMTLMGLVHHPTLWKAGVDLFGVYDWRTFMKTTTGVIRDIFTIEIGPETDTPFLTAISPASGVGRIAVPLFVYAGANDARVPRTESDAIVASLRGRSVAVEYMVAGDEGHSLDRKESVVAFLSRSTRFLEGALRIAE